MPASAPHLDTAALARIRVMTQPMLRHSIRINYRAEAEGITVAQVDRTIAE